MLHRKLLDWQWYQDSNVKTVFLHLLLKVNWRSKVWKKLCIRRGQKLTSYGKLAEETGLTQKQVRGAISKLKATGELETARAANGLLVSIVNYDSYQPQKRSDRGSVVEAGAGEGQLSNNSNKDNKKNIEIPEGLKTLFVKGGWDLAVCGGYDWVRDYKIEWVEEAFRRSLENCGMNPPVRYVRVVLENIARQGGIKGGRKKAKSEYSARKHKKNRKYSGHPAGSGGTDGE